jgi:hypothetical protein
MVASVVALDDCTIAVMAAPGRERLHVPPGEGGEQAAQRLTRGALEALHEQDHAQQEQADAADERDDHRADGMTCPGVVTEAPAS